MFDLNLIDLNFRGHSQKRVLKAFLTNFQHDWDIAQCGVYKVNRKRKALHNMNEKIINEKLKYNTYENIVRSTLSFGFWLAHSVLYVMIFAYFFSFWLLRCFALLHSILLIVLFLVECAIYSKCIQIVTK